MKCGSKPSDGGHLILSDDERAHLVALEPAAGPYIRPFVGSQEFLNGSQRWCLWLENIPPATLKQLPNVLRRVELVKKFREASSAEPTRRAASTPSRFFFVAQPNTPYIAIPEVSSERRTYVPVGYLPPKVIASNKLYIIDAPSLFVFGVLQSLMHGAWIRTVAGRLKSDYQYSGSMVYNTFPWPTLPANPAPRTPEHKAKTAIETAAQAVLDARTKFQQATPPASLADLYDPLTMPPELLKAHQKLDAAVDTAYALTAGLPAKKTWHNDAERVAFLFEQYQRLTSLLPAAVPAKPRRARAKPPSSTAA